MVPLPDSSNQSIKDWLSSGAKYAKDTDCPCAKIIEPGFLGRFRNKPPTVEMNHIWKECGEEFLGRKMRFTECSYEPIEYVSEYAVCCECVVCGKRIVKKETRLI